MKLHLVAPYYPPHRHPIAEWVHAVATGLSEMRHEVVVHTRDRNPSGQKLPPREETGRVTIRRYPARIQAGGQLIHFEAKIQEGAVLLNGYGILVNDLVLKRYNGPMFYHLHHGLKMPNNSLVASVYQAVYNPMWAAPGLKKCRGVLTTTEREHKRLAAMGIPSGQIHLSPYGLPEAWFKPFADAAPEGEGEPYFLYPGPLVRERRPLDLLDALAGLPEGRAIFVGEDGPIARWVTHRADEMGLRHRVQVVTDADEERRLSLVRAARAVVMTQENGFPHWALWAASQARPVAAARTADVPWVVAEGETGLLYPAGDVAALRDHLRSFLNEPKRAEQMGREAHHRAKDLSWNRIVKALERFLKTRLET